MKLTVDALNGDVAIADPNPIEGQLTITLAAGSSWSGEVTQGQLDRLRPYLAELETRFVGAVAKKPLLVWSVSQDSATDTRGQQEALSTQPSLKWMEDAAVAVAGDASVVFKGTNLLAGQSKASRALNNSAGTATVTYTAVKPGAEGNKISVVHVVAGLSTSLSVSVAANKITVNLATDGAGVATSTAAAVVSAVNGHATAKTLVLAAVTAAGTLDAHSEVWCTGGKGGGLSATVAGLAATVVSVTDTALDLNVPALTGVTAGWPVQVVLRSGSQKAELTVATV